MATEAATKSYTCPKCGKVHAADLSAMEGHPEIHGKVHCMGCHVLLWLSLGEDGGTKVEIYEEHLHDVQASAPEGAPAASHADAKPKPAASTSASSPLLLSVVAAAVVAALVSFVVGKATGGAEAAAPVPTSASADAELDGMKATLGAMERELDALRTQIAGIGVAMQKATDGAVTKAAAEAEARVGETVTLLEGRFSGLEGKYTSLDGRIERNYTTLKTLLNKIEGK